MKKIGRVLIWLECRHHMGELFIKPVWVLLFGDDSSPHRIDFSQFKKHFPYIKKENLATLNLETKFEIELKDRAVEFLTSILTNHNSKNQLPTDNYREMI